MLGMLCLQLAPCSRAPLQQFGAHFSRYGHVSNPRGICRWSPPLQARQHGAALGPADYIALASQVRRRAWHAAGSPCLLQKLWAAWFSLYHQPPLRRKPPDSLASKNLAPTAAVTVAIPLLAARSTLQVSVVFIEGVPQLSPARRDEARRFLTLVSC